MTQNEKDKVGSN